MSGKDRTSSLWATALNNCDSGMWGNAVKHWEVLLSENGKK